eukprot:188792-Chlamydomonas_euryale.AAC.1
MALEALPRKPLSRKLARLSRMLKPLRRPLEPVAGRAVRNQKVAMRLRTGGDVITFGADTSWHHFMVS